MALSRVFRDPFAGEMMGKDPFDDFFTSALSPWGGAGVGREVGWPSTTGAMMRTVPSLNLDVKETGRSLYIVGWQHSF